MAHWQITLKYQQELNEARNVMVYEQIGAGTPSWPDVLQEFAVAWSGGLSGSYSPGTGFVGINVLLLEPGAVSLDFNVTGGPLPGTGTDTPGPTQVSSLITIVGSTPLKPARGRIYLPSPNREQYTVDGRFAAAHLNRVIDWYGATDVIDDTEGITLERGIWSRVYPEKAAVQFNRAGSYIAKGIPATQRKRRIGIGS